jgi:hypothetical protein
MCVQTVRQHRAPPTPVLMQQKPGTQPETPQMPGGPALCGKTGVAKPTKSRGGAVVAAVMGQPEKSTCTAGDVHAIRSGKKLSSKALRSPALPAPLSTAPSPPHPRSRHDRVHSKRADHAQHGMRIHKATGSAAAVHYSSHVSAATCQGGEVGLGALVSPAHCSGRHSRSHSPSNHHVSRISPKRDSSSTFLGSKEQAPQPTASPRPQVAVRVSRSDLGTPHHAVLMHSPIPSKSDGKAVPEQDKIVRSNSHSRSPEMHDNRRVGSTPKKSTCMKESSAHAECSTDLSCGHHGDHVSSKKSDGRPVTWEKSAPAVAAEVQRNHCASEEPDRNDSNPHDRQISSKPDCLHAPCSEGLTDVVQDALRTVEHTRNGEVLVSRTCLVTDSQLSLQVIHSSCCCFGILIVSWFVMLQHRLSFTLFHSMLILHTSSTTPGYH